LSNPFALILPIERSPVSDFHLCKNPAAGWGGFMCKDLFGLHCEFFQRDSAKEARE
jgi:hypothetical protein